MNKQIFIGHLGLDVATGELEMQYTLALRGAGGATPEQIEDVVDTALGECEHCYPAIYQVANHGVLATDAADVAMFTTKGEAEAAMATVHITLLGCGKMGSAMLKGWLADPGLNAQFTIIEPHAKHLDWAEAHQQVAIYSDAKRHHGQRRCARWCVTQA